MAIETERRYLVHGSRWQDRATVRYNLKDYLVASFRLGKIRIRGCNEAYSLTLKGLRSGRSRSEYIFDISAEDAKSLIAEFAIGPPIEKIRHEVEYAGLIWQIDDYRGAFAGLVTVDVELPNDGADLPLPPWVGEEITGSKRYSSQRLAQLLAADAVSEL